MCVSDRMKFSIIPDIQFKLSERLPSTRKRHKLFVFRLQLNFHLILHKNSLRCMCVYTRVLIKFSNDNHQNQSFTLNFHYKSILYPWIQFNSIPFCSLSSYKMILDLKIDTLLLPIEREPEKWMIYQMNPTA